MVGLKYLLVLVAIGCYWIVTTDACSCAWPPWSERRKYCTADYAIQARVLDSGIVVGKTRIYRIQILEGYKSTVPWMFVRKDRIYTAREGATCGIRLSPNTRVVLTGSFSGGPFFARYMIIDWCQLRRILEWFPFIPPTCGIYSPKLPFAAAN